MNRMRYWPAKDAPMIEWLRPLSSLLNVPFVSSRKAEQMGTGRHSAMLQRINKKQRKRAKTINMPDFWRLHAQGVGVAEMAAQLGVSTRSVERAMAQRRRDG